MHLFYISSDESPMLLFVNSASTFQRRLLKEFVMQTGSLLEIKELHRKARWTCLSGRLFYF